MRIIKIAVIGLANVGKTTFINTIAGSNLKTANFAGSTTKKNELAMFYKGVTVLFLDLPGFSSFENPENDLAKETVNFLKNSEYDAILHIANSEFSYFSNALDTNLRKNLNKKIITVVNFPSLKTKPQEIEKFFPNAILFSARSKKNTETILDVVISEIDGTSYVSENLLDMTQFYWNAKKINVNLDKVFASKVFGIPIFFAIMFAIFWLSFVLGKVIGDFFVSGFDILIEFFNGVAFLPDFAKALLKSVLVGVGTVIGFMPTIVICVSLLSLLEQTGYVTRVAFLLNKLFEKFNLGGKSLIPLIVGAGCSITAYMSSRMINDPKEKFLTMIIIGFVPCTAKLAVFMLFSLALFGENAPIAIFIIYLCGFIFGLFAAKLVGLFMKNGNSEKTKIELFEYRMPNFKSVMRSGYARTMDYIKNAATFITIFATILSLLSLIGFADGSFVILSEDEISRSLIASIGHFLEPLFRPLDFDFKMIISLITGLVAKETAISTLAVLYSSSTEGLVDIISSQIGFRQAVTYLVFMFFYLPCVSATASFHREAGSLKKTVFLIVFTTFLAYFFAFLANVTIQLFY
jgi:ferrous iron transport protein B